MVRMSHLVLVFALATLISADDVPCNTFPPVVPTTTKPNMDAIIGGSVAGGVAVAAGIGAIVGWEQSHHDDDSRRRRRKDSSGRRRKDSGGGARRRRKEPNWPEDACTPFTTEETCPTPQCEWMGTMCESPCTPFANQSTCPSRCEWRGTSCQVPCAPFTTELTCPPSQCLWNGTSSTCQALCTDFTTMQACTAAQCTWTGILCGRFCTEFTTEQMCNQTGCEWTGASCGPEDTVETINGRVVMGSNETAASSGISGSSSNPWLWVGLALLAIGFAICIAAMLFCLWQPSKKPKKSARKVVAPEPVVAAAEPEVVLPELAPLMSFATPVAAPVYQFAAPVYEVAAPAPVTTTYVLR